MNQDIITYSSVFLDDVNISIIFKENENYDMMTKLFDKYGFGFYYPKSKTIMIDGELFVDTDLTFDDLQVGHGGFIGIAFLLEPKPKFRFH